MTARLAVIVAALIAVVGYAVYARWNDLVEVLGTGDSAAPSDSAPGATPRARTASRGDHGPAPGTRIDIELSSRPSDVYAPRLRPDDADDTYGQIVGSLGARDTVYDPVLARAAREVAYQSAIIGDAPPEDVLTFLLYAVGAPDSHAAMFRLSTTSDDAAVLGDSIRGALADAPDGDGALRVGVGEAATPGERFTRRVVVLLSRRDFELEPTARRADVRSTWTARGQLPPRFSNPLASVLFPDGRLDSVPVQVSGRRFTLSVPVGDVAGTLLVSIDGVGSSGPTKLLQLAVEIGGDLPRRLTAVIPQPDPPFADSASAERHAYELLARDRSGAGLPPLQLDPRLSAVARAHSEEMRDRGYFGHASPTTGLAGDRLGRAGYRSVAHAENLAKNDTLAEAQASLMASVSHRANIVRDGFTHVGIGLARAREGDRDAWYVTQVFSTPVTAIDPDSAPAEVVGRINDARRKAGVRALGVDERLAEVADRAAARAAAGDTAGLPDATAREAQRAVRRSVGVSVHVVYGLDQFEPPDVALRRSMTSAGVGVVQSAADINGRTGLVVIVSE